MKRLGGDHLRARTVYDYEQNHYIFTLAERSGRRISPATMDGLAKNPKQDVCPGALSLRTYVQVWLPFGRLHLTDAANKNAC